MKSLPRSTPAVVTGVALLMLLTTTGGAVAGGLITGKKIKDGTITSADIKDKTIAKKDLAASALAATGATGPAGPPGAPGADGVQGPRGFSAWDVIPSGTVIRGEVQWDHSTTGSQATDLAYIALPGTAPVPLSASTVNFQTGATVIDADATCTGTLDTPTAPPGKVCIYIADTGQMNQLSGGITNLPTKGFIVQWTPGVNTAGQDMWLNATWAYTAP